MSYKLESERKRYHKAYHKKYYQDNKEEIDKKNRAWAKQNPEKIAAHQKHHRDKNRSENVAHTRQWERDNPEKFEALKKRYLPMRKLVSRRHKLRRYDLTLDDYEQMLLEQNRKCRICGLSVELYISIYGRAFDVDHCHTTGSVRGLLCMQCNSGLGMFSDNINTLQKAIEYLQ